jgi:hypothetical protein
MSLAALLFAGTRLLLRLGGTALGGTPLSFADQIVVLRGGVLRQAGPPGEVYRARSTARRRSSSATPSSSMP